MKWTSNKWLLWVILLIVSLLLMADNALLMGIIVVAILGRFSIVFSLERLLILTLFLTLPFSIDITIFSNSKMSLPSEGLLLILFFSFLFNGYKTLLNKGVAGTHFGLNYSILFSTLFFLFTIAFTASFSTMPLVSFKFLLVNLLFVSVGMGYPILLIVQQKVKIRELIQAMTIGLVFSVVYILLKSTIFGIGRGVAPVLPKPFFNDHTHLAATLLLMVPMVFYLWKTELNSFYKRGYLFAFILFIIGLIITFSRASWIGGFVMLSIVVVWYFNIRKEWVLLLSTLGLLLLIVNKSSVESYFQINRNDSNRSESGVGEQLKSVTNINSDVSNMERLNRWKCAVRMGIDKPLYGYGPGTYQFQYFPFQRKNEMTRISVKSPFYIKEGRGGTAHSEYLLSFSESGWIGLISWFLLIGSVIVTYANVVKKSISKDTLLLLQALFLGLIGYFIHAFFNNFLNTPNFALYFWFLIGLLLFLSHQNRKVC